MKLYIIIFLALNFMSLSSYAQTPHKPDKDIELFKEKLQNYYEEHYVSTNIPMHVVPRDSIKHNMPIASVKSLIVDDEIGLAYEFATQKIYDTETKLIYLIEKEKIYDPRTKTFYHYEVYRKQ